MIKKHFKSIVITLSIIALLSVVQEMTSSSLFDGKRLGSFTVIFVPFLILLLLVFFFLGKHRKEKEKSKMYLLLAIAMFPLAFIFLWFSFGQKSTNCYSGNCINGKGTGLYISSEQSSVDVETLDTVYNNDHIFGYAFFNNVSWYDGNPIVEIYIGEYKNGRFHGKGELYRFIYEYDDKTLDPIKINGGFLYKGEFGNGWLYNDRPTRKYYKFGEEYAESLLKKYGLDSMGFKR